MNECNCGAKQAGGDECSHAFDCPVSLAMDRCTCGGKDDPDWIHTTDCPAHPRSANTIIFDEASEVTPEMFDGVNAFRQGVDPRNYFGRFFFPEGYAGYNTYTVFQSAHGWVEKIRRKIFKRFGRS